MPSITRLLAIILCASIFAGCASMRDKAYYGTMEKFGVHKRDILVDRVDEARESQEEAKEEFKDALQAFMSVVTVEGGELEELYNRLNGQLEDAESRANAVDERIDAVEGVASALFNEWEAELSQYSSDRLRRQSEAQLRQTRQQYEQMLRAMRSAESKMQPVLVAFQDQVLFLKHNLNARAIASIQSEVRGIQDDVSTLVIEMERAIAEAERFIEQMRS